MRALLLVTVLALPASGGVRVVAFQKDSAAVVYVETSGDMGDGSELPGELVVLDLRSLERQTFPLDEDVDPSTAPLERLSRKFNRWAGKRTFVPAVERRTSPDGAATLEVEVSPTGAGAWSGGTWSAEGAASWTVTARRGTSLQPVAMTAPADELHAFWTPDGRRTVLVLVRRGTSMRDPGSDELILGSAGQPVVSVAAPSLAQASAVARTLSTAGFVVGAVTQARKVRPTTVIYIREGREPLGKELAARLPKSTVAPLDWQSRFDAVVAVGQR